MRPFLYTFFCLLAGCLRCPAAEEKNWTVFEDCTLIENASNDGDSFHVRYKERSYIFRLYWTDAPETDTRYPDRVHEQAVYFHISDEEALRTGEEATRFSLARLKKGFTVYTTYEDARGASDKKRYYAMIKAGDAFLAESLVAAGLARLKGYRPNPPGALSDRSFALRLMGLEKAARKEGRGAWGKGATGPDTGATGRRELGKATLIFSTQAPHRPIGTLQKGHPVEVLGSAHANLVNIRFVLPSGKTLEGLCEKTSLSH